MSDREFCLEVSKREETGKKVARLREQGFVPGVLYGFGVTSGIPVKANVKDFGKLYAGVETTSLVSVNVDGVEYQCLLKNVEIAPMRAEFLSFDLYTPNMAEEVVSEVEIQFIGESPVEKDGATVVKSLQVLTVEALPEELPETIIVDLSTLKTMDDIIRVKDLALDRTKVRILSNDEEDPVVALSAIEEQKEEELGVEVPESALENPPQADDKNEKSE
jgi:large subunit ribosomal protein L25